MSILSESTRNFVLFDNQDLLEAADASAESEAAAQVLSDLENALKRYRKAIRDHEDDAVAATRKAFEATEKSIEKAQAALLKRIQEAEDAGEPITSATLLQEQRYEALLAQIKDSGETASAKAAAATGQAQAGAVAAAATNAEKFVYVSAGVKNVADLRSVTTVSWNALSADALKTYVGLAGDGSPLVGLFQSINADRADDVRDALFAGIGRGASADAIAAELEKLGEKSANRAFTIARTEVNRASRQASIDSYAANPMLVNGWTWVSSCDLRTCPACWAMHGTDHPASEAFGSHPSCRCCAIPKLVDFRTSLDQPDVRPSIEPGITRFAALGKDDQKKILGPKLFALYEGKQIKLPDVVHVTTDARWGVTRTAASAGEALQSAASRPKSYVFPID